MPQFIGLAVTKEDGTVEQELVPHDAAGLKVRFSFFVSSSPSRVARSPQLGGRQLVAVSDSIAQLTRVTELQVRLLFFLSLI